MALIRVYYVACDGWPSCFNRGPTARDSKTARRQAIRQGWTRRKNAEDDLVDLCPVCKR